MWWWSWDPPLVGVVTDARYSRAPAPDPCDRSSPPPYGREATGRKRDPGQVSRGYRSLMSREVWRPPRTEIVLGITAAVVMASDVQPASSVPLLVAVAVPAGLSLAWRLR